MILGDDGAFLDKKHSTVKTNEEITESVTKYAFDVLQFLHALTAYADECLARDERYAELVYDICPGPKKETLNELVRQSTILLSIITLNDWRDAL